MRERNDSPWYPRHILFRASVEGDWRDAIEAVAARAHEMVASDARTALPS